MIPHDAETSFKKNRFCIGKKQWAQILSVVYLIIVGLVTAIGMLVMRHNAMVLKVITTDFEQERAKHAVTDVLSQNELKLEVSKEHVLKNQEIWTGYIWVLYVQCISSVLFCYGLTTKSTILILQWVFCTGFVLVLATLFAIAYHCGLDTFYWYHSISVVYWMVAPIWAGIWYFFYLYSMEHFQEVNMIDRTVSVVKTKGGLTHTLIP